MSRVLLLTDDLIREALEPAPGLVTPDRVLDAIATGIRETPQRRTVVDRFGVAAPALPALHLGIADRRLGWLLAAAVLGAVVLGAAAVGAWLLRDTSMVELVPTGVEVMAPDAGYTEAVLDGKGVGWAIGGGHVTRFDPATGEHRTWTIADDATFSQTYLTDVTGAAAGGIWMLGGPGIVRFDGTAFRDGTFLPVPDAEPTALDESPDGALWVAFAAGVYRWDGTSWASFPGADDCRALIAVGPDEVWATCHRLGSRVLHLVDGSWEGFDSFDARSVGGLGAAAMAEGPDGSILVARAQYGVARWSGGRFVDLDGPEFSPEQLEVTSEGAVWVVGEGRIARLVAGSWQEVEPPGTGSEWLDRIAAVGADLVATTDAGLYRYDTSGWEPLWSDPPTGPSVMAWLGGPLVAVSADEAWAADRRGVWHYVDGRWAGPEGPAEMAADSFINDLAVEPGGRSVAIATDDGVAVRDDTGWTWAWHQRGASVAYAPDASLWALSGVRLVHLVETGGRLSSTTVQCPGGGSSMAVAIDGSVWVGRIDWGLGGVRRYDGSSCREVDVPVRDVIDIQADPTGGVVITVSGSQTGVADGLSHYTALRSDGGEWSTLRESLIPGYPGDALAIDGDGRVWVADVGTIAGDGQSARFEPGIKRLEEGTWRMISAVDSGSRLSLAPDGTLWMVGSSGIERISADQLR